MPIKEHARADAAQTQFEIYVACPISPVRSGMNLVVCIGDSEDVAQEEGPFISTGAADVSYNIAKSSLIPLFFTATNIRKISIGEIKAGFWRNATAPVPPRILPSTHSCVVHPSMQPIAPVSASTE